MPASTLPTSSHVNEQFADRFYNRLARFYGLDPAQYSFPVDLQHAILQRRAHVRSLLVLDNIETLIDAQRSDHPVAVALASFLRRLKEGDGSVLFTSRMLPPSDWGNCEIVHLTGLSDEAGAALFHALLSADRIHLAPLPARQMLSQRVQGHPFSIRLLAGRFADESTTDLSSFLEHIEGELEQAEQTTPTSIEDPERQRTLYACIDYSVKRLTPEQRTVLDATRLFQAPFLPEFVADVLDDEVQTPLHLQNLVRLSLLEISARTFKEGELVLLELHPMLRWYIQHHHPESDATVLEHYGEVYAQLARSSYETYDRDSRVRYLVRQSLPDCEAALEYFPPARRSWLAYHLARPYERIGQNRRALTLYEQVLEISQAIGERLNVAMAQHAIATVLWQQGKPTEALATLQQALQIKQDLGDVHGIAVTQHAMANVLWQQGKPHEALILYQQALQIKQDLGDMSGVALTQTGMADVLVRQGKPHEAKALYQQALRTKQELGDMRGVAATQHAIADVLVQQGKPDEALALYLQALQIKQDLGDMQEIAATQSSMANALVQQGKPHEALALYEQALQTKQNLGNVRSIAVTQHSMANLLRQLGRTQEAIAIYEQILQASLELGDLHSVRAIRNAIADVMLQQGKLHEAMALYEQALQIKQELEDVHGVATTQYAMANVLLLQGKLHEAMALYQKYYKLHKS